MGGAAGPIVVRKFDILTAIIKSSMNLDGFSILPFLMVVYFT